MLSKKRVRTFDVPLSSRLTHIAALFTACLIVNSCATAQYTPYKNLRQLTLGMSTGDVVTIMGQPNGIIPQDGGTIYRYQTHQYYRGVEPYDILFDANGKLIGFFRNEELYYAQEKIGHLNAQDTQAALADLSAFSNDRQNSSTA